MKDDRKPLRNKEDTDYTEMYALEVLQQLFPLKYRKLRHGDKPDIYDEFQSVGIEVTVAVNPKMAAAMNEWNLSFYEDSEEKKNERRRKMERYGECFQGGIQVWKHMPCKEEDIINIIQAKANKFENYAHFKTVDLYVETLGNYSLVDYGDEPADFGNSMMKKIREIKVQFRYVYIEIIDYVYCFDVKNNTYMIYPFPSDESAKIGIIVRKEILDKRDTLP